MKWATVISGLAACAGLASAMAVEKRQSTCNSPHIAGLYFIGGNGGSGTTQFCETKWPGPILVTGLQTFSNGNISTLR